MLKNVESERRYFDKSAWVTNKASKGFCLFFFLNYKTSNKWVWKLIKIRRTTYARTHTRTVEMQLSNKILNYN